MKKLVYAFVIFITTFHISYSQPYQAIHTANFLITKFYSFSFSNDPVKKIFFQEQGLTGDPCPNDPVGFHTFQVNKNNFQIYRPFNGFLDRFQCEVFITGCDRHAVDYFTISHLDSNLIIKYMNYAGAPSPQCAPFKRSNITTNGGVSSTTIFNNQVLYGCDIDPSNDNIIYAGVEDNIYKSTNRGTSWLIASNLPDLNGFVKVNPLRTNDVFAVGVSNMFLSTNAGSSFFSLTAPPFHKIVFNKIDSSIYGITSSSVYKSINHGINWTQVASIPLINTIEINPDNPDIVYIGTQNKVYRSINGGGTFNQSNLALPNSNKIIGISKDSGTGDTLFLCTDKAIFKVWDLQTDIKKITSTTPSKFKLHQNFPNPFNPGTTIRFDILHSSYVKLIIYDILGKEISSLVNRELQNGSYEAYWPAPTGDAAGQPSGIYFYRIEVINNDKGSLHYSETKRMLFIK